MNFKNHHQKKRFGQHWLVNNLILEKIKEVAELEEKDFILEIGPGRGALTSKLLDSKISRLHAIELDKDLIDHLNNKFKNDKNFTLEQGDILSTNIELRVFLIIFLLELNEILRSLSKYFSILISKRISGLNGSKTTKEENTFGGGLKEDGGTSHILLILEMSCIRTLRAPAFVLPSLAKILSTTSFCIKKIIFL